MDKNYLSFRKQVFDVRCDCIANFCALGLCLVETVCRISAGVDVELDFRLGSRRSGRNDCAALKDELENVRLRKLDFCFCAWICRVVRDRISDIFNAENFLSAQSLKSFCAELCHDASHDFFSGRARKVLADCAVFKEAELFLHIVQVLKDRFSF